MNKQLRELYERTLNELKAEKVDSMLRVPLDGQGNPIPSIDSPIFIHYVRICKLIREYENLLAPKPGDRRLDEEQMVFEFYERRA